MWRTACVRWPRGSEDIFVESVLSLHPYACLGVETQVTRPVRQVSYCVKPSCWIRDSHVIYNEIFTILPYSYNLILSLLSSITSEFQSNVSIYHIWMCFFPLLSLKFGLYICLCHFSYYSNLFFKNPDFSISAEAC